MSELKKILLLSAYDAESHRRWRLALAAQFPDIDWVQLSLAPRWFNWRIRGNPLTWALNESEVLNQAFSQIWATSMTDLATLRGLVPSLAAVPTYLYFHENQFAYPLSDHQKLSVHKNSLEPKMVQLYSALAADRLLFNSAYNRDTFLAGVADLLQKMPDEVPRGVAERLGAKAQTLHVPLECDCYLPKLEGSESNVAIEQDPPVLAAERPSLNSRQSPHLNPAIAQRPLEIVWNHRWEYDKGPQQLLEILQMLPSELSLTVHIVGQKFRRSPKEFEYILALLQQNQWLGSWGYVESEAAYRQLLCRSDVVLSTALHDFQGLSVLEAVAAGCIPLVPLRLAYEELFEPHWCYPGEVDSPSASQACAELIQRYCQNVYSDQGLPMAPSLDHLSWRTLSGDYRRLIDNIYL